MYKISKWKLFSTIFFTILAIIYVLPNFYDSTKVSWLPGDKINLGLDLRGGSHLMLSVDFDSYMNDVTNVTSESIKKALRNKKIGYKNVKIIKGQINFDIRKEKDVAEVKKIIKSIDSNLSYTEKNSHFIIYYNEYAINQLQDKVVDQSIEIIRMRVDSNGTKEPNIQRYRVKDILLQVPGEDDPATLKRMLGKTAKLTFHLVDNNVDFQKAASGNVPNDTRVVNDENGHLIVIKKKAIVGGEQLNDASAQFSEAKPVVNFSFNHLGAKKFAEATTKYTGRQLAIILDGKVLSAPVINQPIIGGNGVISGNFTLESANELALMLRAGALPAPLKIIEEKTVGPNLGKDSIESGKKAALVGFLLVVIFMVLSYGMMGIFANITLVLALLYIFAMLSMLQATLTLPGIAGIILTIGMAVDANVLIYERIREELMNRKCSNAYAVKIGFDSAFNTITDSNVTTLIAAFLLYSFGVGAIKGFAVTLTIGIIASMYTALIVTKLIIDIWLKYFNPKKIL